MDASSQVYEEMENFPQSPTDVLMVPMIVLLFGLVVYGAGLANGLSARTPPKYRWTGTGLMVVSLILGFMTMYRLYDGTSEFYRAMIGNRKVLLAHYVGFFLPLLLLACTPLAELWFRRAQRDML